MTRKRELAACNAVFQHPASELRRINPHSDRTLLPTRGSEPKHGFLHLVWARDANPAKCFEPSLDRRFTVKQQIRLDMRRGYFQGAMWNRYLLTAVQVKCALTYVKRARDPRYHRLKSVRLTLSFGASENLIEIIADEDGKISQFKTNGFDGTDQFSSIKLHVGRGRLVPNLALYSDAESSSDSESEQASSVKNPLDRKLLAETGAPIGVQQKLMRHSNVSTTMNVYGNSTLRAKQQANSKLVQMIMRPEQPSAEPQQMSV